MQTIERANSAEDLDLKRSTSELGKSVDAQEEQDDNSTRVASVWGTFLGRDRQMLAKESLVWNQGAGPFFASIGKRCRSIFTKRFLLCLVAGQTLSLAITSTSVLTTELGNHGWALPCTQTLFMYFLLNMIYTPLTIYKYGFKAWCKMIMTDGWKYIFLGAVDVEANFLVVKAFGYTDLLSCLLLNSWSTPACMFFAFFLVKARFHWTQILGVCVAITGLGLTVVSDHITDKNYPANNRVLGDILMLIGATGYGLSNALVETFVRRRPIYEVIGQLAFWATIINAIQGAALEHHLYHTVSWSGGNVGYLLGYTGAMLFLYTMSPILYRLSSSPFYNISIDSSNFYGLCFGLALFGYSPYWLYFVGYAFVLVGLCIYFCVARPEAQSHTKVEARGHQQELEEESGHKLVVGANV